MKTHLRLDFVARALPLIYAPTGRGYNTGPWAFVPHAADWWYEEQESKRAACRRGAPLRFTRSTPRQNLALPQLGELPTCINCLMLWDAAQEAGLA